MELLADKKWPELIVIFENQVDYRSVIPSQFNQEIQINRLDQKHEREERRFNGNCNYCNKPGHKWAVCRKRMSDSEGQKGTNGNRNEANKHLGNVSRKPNNGSYQKTRSQQVI